ncbi:MAG: DUF2279 domain-containing protein, partial [Bacteroidota bacterium]|nr:DUF2279 domain-containing protein [Bacteroidota bacterium]
MHRGFGIFCILIMLMISPAWSQKNSSYFPDTSISVEDDLSFFVASPYRNKARIRGLSIGIPTAYGAIMSALSIAWYDQNERNRFHFFNDAKEWQQVDKLGHSHTAYFETYWMMQSLRWAGVDKKKSRWIGAALGFTIQSSIEVVDGFSEKWGASGWDVLANFAGTALCVGQDALWGEQRIRSKFSFHEVNHSDAMLNQRADALYGTFPIERLLKDYNGIITWISINPASFMRDRERQRPLTWLNVAIGYGGSGMYGGFDNTWTNENGDFIERQDIERYRRFFISPDIDFERISVRKKGWKTLMSVLNVFKCPAPALEVNTKGEWVFHPMFMLNWDYPIVLNAR